MMQMMLKPLKKKKKRHRFWIILFHSRFVHSVSRCTNACMHKHAATI